MAISEPVGTVADGAARSGARRRLGRWLREPMLHFLIAGGLLFGAAEAWRSAHDAHRIVVTRGETAALAEKYRLQFGADPTPAQLEGLVLAFVREEALSREAVAVGIAKDDEVVRRRLSQKLTFLLQDEAQPPEPKLAQLRAWFAAHPADYAAPARTSFRHLYFSTDAVGDGPARVRAARALAALRAGGAPEQAGADPFPDQDAYVNLSADEAQRLFGDSGLAHALGGAPVGQWSGPYRSGYGWHLVQVESHTAAARPDFEAVREQVREDWLDAARQAANARAVDRVVGRYAVVRQDVGAP